jgi:hypothetical protein
MGTNYMPLVTDDYKIAFLQATEPLCPDVHRLIWDLVLDIEPKCPPAPLKFKSAAAKHLLRKAKRT